MNSYQDRLTHLEDQIQTAMQLIKTLDLRLSGSLDSLKHHQGQINPHEHLTLFTAKQHAVLQMLCEGISTSDMSGVLSVSESTIKVHLRSIMRKTALRSRQSVAAWYHEIIVHTAPDQYLKYTTIPIDWYANRKTYEDVTRFLKTKVR